MRFSGSAVSAGEVQNIVTSSVLKQNIDYFFWPAINNETFAPGLTGCSYSSNNGLPSYFSPTTARTNPVTRLSMPAMPRVGFNGKSNLTVSWKQSNVAGGNFNESHVHLFGLGDTSGGVCGAQFTLSHNIADGINIARIGIVTKPIGGAQTVIDNLFALSDSNYHSYQIELDSSGSAIFSIDGVVINTVANIWPTNALSLGTSSSFLYSIPAVNSTAWGFNVGEVLEQWT